MKTRYPILFICAALLFGLRATEAQFDVGSLIPDGLGNLAVIEISSQPKYPRPNQSVVVSLASFSTDLNRAQISWYVNGLLAESGSGLLSITTTAGGSGKTTTVSADITTAEGALVTKTLSFRPSELDLVWEAESYTPPFYRGKALYPLQGDVRIVALPHMLDDSGSPIPAHTLIYTWKQDGTVLGSKSGYGRNALRVAGSVLGRQIQVTATAETSDNTHTATKTIIIPTATPRVVFYETHPLLGTRFERALSGTVPLTENEMRISAVPYFFSGGVVDALRYSWRLGGNAISETGNEIIVRHENGAQGTTAVSVDVTHPADILQSADASFSISFGN